MRIVFAGTPKVAVPSLAAMLESEHEVIAVITRDDAPQGRKRVLTPSPVGAFAAANGIPVIKANRLDDETTKEVMSLDADLGVIVAYGGLVREPLLSTPQRGWINLHFSLLPAWRGAAPVQHAVINGETETGVSVFQLVRELDAGALYTRQAYEIGPDQTSGELLADLAEFGAEALVACVSGIASGSLVPEPQEGAVTLAPKLSLDDARLDWSQSAAFVYSRLRGVTPEPGAFTTIGGATLKIHAASKPESIPDVHLEPGEITFAGKRVLIGTGTEPLELVRVQPAGKQAMAAGDWWRGLKNEGTVTAQ